MVGPPDPKFLPAKARPPGPTRRTALGLVLGAPLLAASPKPSASPAAGASYCDRFVSHLASDQGAASQSTVSDGTSGMPPAIAQRLRDEVAKAVAAPDVIAQLDSQGMQPLASQPKEWHDYMQVELDRYAKIIKDANIKPESD